MKLRVRGDSLRLRLTQAEVARVGAGERVEESIRFGAGAADRLVYAIMADEKEGVRASFASNEVCIMLPRTAAREWANGSDVSIEAKQPIDDAAELMILVEKDFACLKPRAGEDDTDAFPNPLARS